MDEIGEAVTAYTDEISRMLEEAGETDIVILEYFYYFLDSRQNTASISEAVSGGSGTRYYRPALREPSDYFRERAGIPRTSILPIKILRYPAAASARILRKTPPGPQEIRIKGPKERRSGEP